MAGRAFGWLVGRCPGWPGGEITPANWLSSSCRGPRCPYSPANVDPDPTLSPPPDPVHTVPSKSFTCSPFPSPARPPLELEHSAKVVFKLRAAGGLQRVGFQNRDRPRCWGASSLGSRPPWQGELPYQPASFPPLSSSLSIQLSTVSDQFSPVLSSSSITEDGLSEKKLFPFSARPVAGKS